MPDHSIAVPEGAQGPGQPTLDEIGQQLAAVMQCAAEAPRVLLECHFEAVKLLRSIQEQHGYRSKRYTEFASFIAAHENKGRGLTAVARHTIAQARKGINVAMVVPVNRIVTQLLEAGATVRSLGRVKWLHAITGDAESVFVCAVHP